MLNEFLWDETLHHKIVVEQGGNELTGYWLSVQRDNWESERFSGLNYGESVRMFNEAVKNIKTEVENAKR